MAAPAGPRSPAMQCTPRRPLPRWARFLLCLALLPVVLLVPLVVIGLWPGLRLEIALREGDPFGWRLQRCNHGGVEYLRLKWGVGCAEWTRNNFPSSKQGLFRAVRRSRTAGESARREGFAWVGERQQIWIQHPTRRSMLSGYEAGSTLIDVGDPLPIGPRPTTRSPSPDP